MAYNFSPKMVTDGLVLYLDAANTRSYTSGSTLWNDLTINGINGTLINNPQYSSQNMGIFIFNGANDCVRMGNILNNVLAGTNNRFTLCSWVYRTGTTTQGILIGKNADSNLSVNERQVQFSYRNDKFDLVITSKPDNTGWTRVVTTTPTFTLNKWYYACCTYDGSINTNNGLDRVKIYVDGQNTPSSLTVSSGTLTNTIDGSNAQLSINAMVNSSGNIFGSVNSRNNIVKIYNRVLSQQEITQNFNALRGRFGI